MNGPDNLLPSPIDSAAIPEVINHTQWPTQYFQMIDTSDAIFHVMVTRITYDLTQLDSSGFPALAEEQTELVDSDEFVDAPNLSSVLQESDYAPYKPKCDVLFANAVAHAPLTGRKRKPLARFPAGVRIEFADGGQWQKLLTVTGPRSLSKGALGGLHLTEPEPTLAVPIRYEHAFGGTNQWWKGWPTPKEDDQRFEIDLHHDQNPIGCGLIDGNWQKKSRLSSFPAPQIEAFAEPFTQAHAEAAARSAGNPDAEPAYPVVGLGAIGRWWLPRRARAGSYNDLWKQTRWPKLPQDFDFGYWNAAPEDQQIDYPVGGEKLMLVNLIDPERSVDGALWFRIPKQDLKLLVRLEVGAMLFAPMKIDTLIVDLDAMQLVVVRRTLVGASADVRQLELGNWPDGTTMETSEAMAHLIAAQNQGKAARSNASGASSASGTNRHG